MSESGDRAEDGFRRLVRPGRDHLWEGICIAGGLNQDSSVIEFIYLRGGFGCCVENRILGKRIAKRDGRGWVG